jgi:FkbM family methyltransferase
MGETGGSGHSGAKRVKTVEARRVKYTDLVDTLRSLSHAKQLDVIEAWPGAEFEIEHGLKITARSKKEMRRFTRPIHPSMVEWLSGFDAGDVFYDIGANCGSLTLLTGALHRHGVRLIPIEPGFANFESLVRHLSQNEMLGHAIPIQAALLDRTGLEPMNYWRRTEAGTSLHTVGEPVDADGREFTPAETQMMPTYRLDDLIGMMKLPAPTRMKIDVDGAERAVLGGAPKTLAGGTIRELAVEVTEKDRQRSRLNAVRTLLESADYQLAQTFKHGDEPGFVADYLFRRR